MSPPPAHERAQEALFVDALGTRIALLGHESGEFELWIWPLKVAHGIALDARPLGAPGRGAARVSSVRAAPECLELTWVHPEFTLLQRVLAAPRERALVVLVERQSGGPVELALRLTPDFVPMWPAGLGGRIATRDARTGALLLTEELGRFACLCGGPEVDPVDAHGDHDAAAGQVALRARLTADRAPGRPLAFVFAGAELESAPLSEAARLGRAEAATGLSRAARAVDAARATFERVGREWAQIERERATAFRGFRARTARLRSSDRLLDRAFEEAKLAIETAWVEVDGLGRGLVAGLGPSRGGERPGFAWFFDGDALIAARAMAGYGDFEGAREVLRFAASHQRADGKLMHELVLSARFCNWLEEYPYAYYKADNPPRFASVLEQVVDASGDLGLARELLPVAARALRWMEGCLDARGLLSNRRAGIAAVEAGPMVGRIESEAFLQGLWLDSLDSLARMAGELGEGELAARAGAHLARARAGFESLWCNERGHYAFAHLVDGARDESLSTYVAHGIARGFGAAEHALSTARHLNEPRLVTDWGARMFAEDSAAYDPGHYNTGSVFPYLTQFVALALYAQGLPDAGFQLLSSLAALSGFSGRGYIPEHLRGDRAVAPARGVPHQIFSSSALLQVVLTGLFGFEPRAVERRVRFTPALPPGWSSAELDDLRVGDARLDVDVIRNRTRDRTFLRIVLERRGGEPLSVELRPIVAPLSELVAARSSGEPVDAHVVTLPSGTRRIELAPLHLDARLEVEVELRGGPRLVLPPPEIAEGAASHGLRLCDHQVDGERVTFELWGYPGHRYRVPCRCDFDWEIEYGALRVGDALVLEFPPTNDGKARRALVTIRVRRG